MIDNLDLVLFIYNKKGSGFGEEDKEYAVDRERF